MSDNLIFDMCRAVGEFEILTSDRCIWNKKLPGKWPSVLREEPGFWRMFSDLPLFYLLCHLCQAVKANGGMLCCGRTLWILRVWEVVTVHKTTKQSSFLADWEILTFLEIDGSMLWFLERHCFYIMSSCPSSIMSLFKKILGNWDLLFVGEGVSQNQGPDSLVRIYNSKEEWRLCQMRESFPLQRQWKTKNQNISWHQTESPNLSWSLPVCLFMPVILVKITVVE